MKNISPKTIKEFQDTGLLLFINQFLHIFGWAVVIEITDNKWSMYPARVKFRGFSEKSTTKAYKKLTQYMCDNHNELQKEVNFEKEEE